MNCNTIKYLKLEIDYQDDRNDDYIGHNYFISSVNWNVIPGIQYVDFAIQHSINFDVDS